MTRGRRRLRRARPLRGAQAGRGATSKALVAHDRIEPCPLGRPLLPLRHGDRAAGSQTSGSCDMKPLAEPAIEAVRDGRIEVHSRERWSKTYFHWMENIRDWCISRQLWWGHRIPVWYCDDCDEIAVARDDPSHARSAAAHARARTRTCSTRGSRSALWPFSTLGWPDETPDLRVLLPDDVLVTGYDILFFWVARMIMIGLDFTGDVAVPRRATCTAWSATSEGRKMSQVAGQRRRPARADGRSTAPTRCASRWPPAGTPGQRPQASPRSGSIGTATSPTRSGTRRASC